MRIRKILPWAFTFLVGFVVGIATPFLIICFLSHGYSESPLTSHRKIFGDIKIWAQKPLIEEGIEVPDLFYQKAHKLLYMTKDDVPFLSITQNEAGKTSYLFLLKGKDTPVLCLESLGSLGKWGMATYSEGGNGTNKLIGDAFVDIDFDGRFDFKLSGDRIGNLVSRSIFIDSSWQKVDACNTEKRRARIAETIYCFDPNSGYWRKE